MQVLNAMDLKAGKKAERNKMGGITQPIQFIPREEKDEQWAAWNMDWLEWNGMKQLARNARRLLKNYKLAKGVIDKTDYIVEESNEMADLVETLISEDSSALELKFYPIIPNIINVLTTEFAKRNTTISFRSVDEFAYNEMLEQKREAIQKVLFKNAEQKIFAKMIEMGADPNDPEVQAQLQQQTDPEALKTLPEIEQFFSKSYRSLAEQWAMHQTEVDRDRFGLDELEERGFRDSLITDRAFFHFAMGEDDYNVELWNPVTTFYHKSPDVRYISQGNWVGKTEMYTIADVIDKYGYLMTTEQMESLEAIYPVKAAGYAIDGQQNDGSFYDATRSHAWNTNAPGVTMRQFTSVYDGYHAGGDIIDRIMSESEDYGELDSTFFLRVTTAYWKSQRKVGLLTDMKEDGTVDTDIVDETFVVTNKPLYNTTLFKNKDRRNLLFGQHVEWVYINHVYGGIKIGNNRPTMYGMENPDGFDPIYIGIDQNKIGPLKFQFKGDNTIYGCKLPVEGCVFSDRNTKSTGFVDLTKAFQIGYNIVNNQIADILVDELGTVILFDQNMFPKHSLNEDWGKDPYANAFVAMKNFQMLPIDTSIANTETPLNFNQFHTLNMEQTARLMSRVQLANHFKQQLYEAMGFTPQRLGQQIGQTDTAKGVEQSVAGSFAQTEGYFIQYADNLLPRVHQMRTDVAQYYQSTKPSVRLQYAVSADERVNFEINGTELLLADINIKATTKANHRAVIEEIKAMAKGNNTSGATIYDLGNVIKAKSMAEVTHILKAAETKNQKQIADERAHEEKMAQIESDQRTQEAQMKLDRETLEKEKDRRLELLVAQIKAAGYGAMQDIDQNQQSDFQDVLGQIQQTDQFNQVMNFDRQKEGNKVNANREKMNLEYAKLQTARELKEKDLQVARENQTKAELDAKRKARKKDTK